MNYILFCVFLWLVLGYIIKIPKKGIPILNFKSSDIDSESLEEQILFFLRSGYQILPFRQLYEFIIDETKVLSNKPLFLTFCVSNHQQIDCITTVLQKYNLPATLFLCDDLLVNLNQDLEAPTLSFLNTLNRDLFSIGLSSLSPKTYTELSFEDISQDLETTISHFTDSELKVLPILYYPNGKSPTDPKILYNMKLKMKALGINMGLKYAKSLNKTPFDDPFEIQYNFIDIADSSIILKSKLKGKL